MRTLSTWLLLLAPLPVQGDVVVAGREGKALDAYLSTCEAFGFSGVVLVEHEGELVLSKGYGTADPLEGTPNTPDTLYDIASASKQVTAAAVLLLEARGALSVEDRLADHLPDVPKELHDITLAHLIHHTSGFPRSGPAGRGGDRAAAVATYLSGERKARAGERFEYYNGGYALLAAVVEEVTGSPFEDFVREQLFRPAGLEHTDFIETAGPDAGPLAISLDTRKPTTEYIRGWGYRGMGGVLTSANELRTWCGALFSGRVLPKEQLAWMLTPDRDDYAGGWYVFDTERKRRVVQHGGSTPSFDSYVRWFPAESALIVVLCNRKGWNWQVTWGLSELLLDELPKAPRPPDLEGWSDRELQAWLGDWVGDGNERVQLERAGAGVRLNAIGTEISRALRGRSQPGKGASTKELEAKQGRALAIVDELAEGRCDILAENLLPHIPASWPARVRDDLWPAHVERWGAVRGRRCLGSFYDHASRRVRVWVRLDQERAARSVEVAFVGDALNIFDLNAADWPIEDRAAPVEGELVGFDFSEAPPFRIALEGKGKRARLVLRGRNGTKVELRQP